MPTTYRHLSVTHDDLRISLDECASIAWPKHARYVTWAYSEATHVFRAYIEFAFPMKMNVLADIPSQMIEHNTHIVRSARRDQVRHLQDAAIWEFGEWDAGRRGASKKTPDVREQLMSLQARVEAQDRLIAELRARSNTTTNNNNTINITINNFGTENTCYLDPEVLARRCIAEMNGVIATIKDVHFNDDHPENHTVKMITLRDKTAAIRVNGEWKCIPADVAADKLLWNGYTINMQHHQVPDVFASTDVEMEKIAKFQQWQSEMVQVKHHTDVRRGPVRLGRQQVLTMMREPLKPKPPA